MEVTFYPSKFNVSSKKGLIKVGFEIEMPEQETAAAVLLIGLQFDTKVTLATDQMAFPELIRTVVQVQDRNVDPQTGEFLDASAE